MKQLLQKKLKQMFDLILLFFLVPFKKAQKWARNLYDDLCEFYFDLDPIKDCNSLEEIVALKEKRRFRSFFLFPWIKISLHFLPPALLCTYWTLDNVYYIFIENGGQYNATGMPEFLTHRITPFIFWDISDILINAGVTQELLIYWYLTRKPNVKPEYFMFAVWNASLKKRTIYYKGKFWKQAKSDVILKKRALLRRIYSPCMVAVFLQQFLYYVGWHHLNGDHYTARNLWLYFLVSVWAFYTSYALIYIAFYFHLVTNYIQFKQKCKIRKINSLLEEMARISQGKHPNKSMPHLRWIIWTKFCVCNRKILTLFKEMSAYNNFWSFVLTDYVFGYVVMMCYLAYGFFFGGADSLLMKSLYLFFSAQMFTTIMLFTSECSIIVRKNVEIYKNNRRFAFAFSKVLQPDNTQLLRLSKMISNYKGTRTGFRFINNGIIDSRMFEILFLSISILFMKILKKKIMGKDYVG